MLVTMAKNGKSELLPISGIRQAARTERGGIFGRRALKGRRAIFCGAKRREKLPGRRQLAFRELGNQFHQADDLPGRKQMAWLSHYRC